MRTMTVSGLLVAGLAAGASAQSNTIDGLDAKLDTIADLRAMGREGNFPNGMNGVSFETTVCNIGTVGIAWKAPMKARHPMIAFIVIRELNGRFEQISDRSFVKHGFFATNNSDCNNCTDTSDSSVLAPGCSDTYFSSNNGDRFWLGPASEIDPWLGDWEPACSHFDRGEPPVPPPDDCDGIRSLTQNQVDALGPVTHRMEISDADLNVAGAKYYFYGQYVVRGEVEGLRSDNAGSRQFVPTWDGNSWDLDPTGGLQRGSILRRWTGATLTSNSNGVDDGRVFIGSVVTGPDGNGRYHYEYAVHNRDNARGISAFQVPFLPGATITNAGFRDIDPDGSNDWSFQVGPAEATWSTTANPLEWNTVYNFWFDCDVAPGSAVRTLVAEARAGAGLAVFDIATNAPVGPLIGTNLGFGKTGGNGLAPDFTLSGGLGVGERADLMIRYAAPDAMGVMLLASQNGNFAFRGGTIVPYPPEVILVMITDPNGQIFAGFDGAGGTFDVFAQLVLVDPAASGEVSMSNALEIVN